MRVLDRWLTVEEAIPKGDGLNWLNEPYAKGFRMRIRADRNIWSIAVVGCSKEYIVDKLCQNLKTLPFLTDLQIVNLLPGFAITDTHCQLISRCDKLKYLAFSNCSLLDGGFNNLRENGLCGVKLLGCTVSVDVFHSLARMNSIRFLYLSGVRDVSEEILQTVLNNTRLRTLNLSGTNLAERVIDQIIQLKPTLNLIRSS